MLGRRTTDHAMGTFPKINEKIAQKIHGSTYKHLILHKKYVTRTVKNAGKH